MNSTNLSLLKDKVIRGVERLSDELFRIAKDIHAHPETGWETPPAAYLQRFIRLALGS